MREEANRLLRNTGRAAAPAPAQLLETAVWISFIAEPALFRLSAWLISCLIVPEGIS